MSLAAETREAVRARPFLYEGLRAGVINYTAAARMLDVEGDTDAIATALRRFAEELPTDQRQHTSASVTMHSGLGRTDDDAPLLAVGETCFTEGAGSLTGIVATGDLTAAVLGDVVGRFRAAEITVEAAGVTDDTLVVVVERRAGPEAVQIVEDTT
jgi:hypothetical protein